MGQDAPERAHVAGWTGGGQPRGARCEAAPHMPMAPLSPRRRLGEFISSQPDQRSRLQQLPHPRAPPPVSPTHLPHRSPLSHGA